MGGGLSTYTNLDRTGRNILRFAFLLRDLSFNSLASGKAKDQTRLHFFILALRISFPGHVVEELDAMRANQVDGTLALENQLIRYIHQISQIERLNQEISYMYSTLIRVNLALLGTNMST